MHFGLYESCNKKSAKKEYWKLLELIQNNNWYNSLGKINLEKININK